MTDRPSAPRGPGPAWVSSARGRAVVAVLAVLTCVAWWVAGDRVGPAVAVGLVAGGALAWSILAWGLGRLPELMLWWLVAAVLVAYVFAWAPEPARPPIAALVLLGPPVGYLLAGRGRIARGGGGRVVAACVAGVVPAAVGALLAALPTVNVVHALGWGYDNAAHVANTGAFLRQGTFFFLDDRFLDATFSFYRPYPGGTYALWNLFTSASGLDTAGFAPSDLVALYATFLVGTTALFLAMCVVLVQRTSRRWETSNGAVRPGRVAVGVAAGVAVAVVVVGSLSHLLWSGWPALLAGYAALLAYVAIVVEGRRSPWPIGVSTGVAVLATAYTYPLLLPLVAAAAVAVVLSDVCVSGWRAGARWLTRPVGLVVLVGCAVLTYEPLRAARRGGGGSLLAFGDIEPVGWAVAGAGAVLAGWLVVVSVRRRDWLVATLVPAAGVFAAGLCAYSVVQTSTVQYYPMRAAYTFVILVLLLAVGVLAASTRPPSRTAVVGGIVLVGFVATTVFVGFSPQVFTGRYMGATPQAVGALWTGDVAADTFGCGRLIMAGATAVREGQADHAVVVAGDAVPVDLGSRWANALAYRMYDGNRFLTMGLDELAGDPAGVGRVIGEWRAAGGTGQIVVVADPAVAWELQAAGLPAGTDLVVAACTS